MPEGSNWPWNHSDTYPKGATFGELLDWHLSYWCTNPDCNTECRTRNKCTTMEAFAETIHTGAPGTISSNPETKLRNWRKGKYLPKNKVIISNIFKALFDDRKHLEIWKIDLEEALERERLAKSNNASKVLSIASAENIFLVDRSTDIDRAATAIVSDIAPKIEELIRNAAFMAKVADVGLTKDQVRNLLYQFGCAGAPIDQAERLLLNAAQELRKLREQLTRLSNDDPEVVRLRAEALVAIELANLEDAKVLLMKAVNRDEASIGELRDALQNRRLSAAGSLGQAALISSAQASFRDAADLLSRAARMAEPADIHVAWWYWIDAAAAHAFHASVFPSVQDAKAAAEIVERHNIPLAKQLDDPIMLQRAWYELADDLKVWADGVTPDEAEPILRRALSSAYEAVNLLTPDSSSALRISGWLKVGDMHLALGRNLLGQDGVDALRNAVSVYQHMMTIINSENPAVAHKHQCSLALALRGLSDRVMEPEATEVLDKAINLYKDAISTLVKSGPSENLIEARINLASALGVAAERSGGNHALALHHAALEETENALEIIDSRKRPMDWALAMSNKALFLRKLAASQSDADNAQYIRSAIRSYKSTLTVHSPTDTPNEWVRIHNNLGSAHYTLAHLDTADCREELLAAEKALRTALAIGNDEILSDARATTLSNLGLVLRAAAFNMIDAEKVASLQESVECLGAAILIRSQDSEPFDWAATSGNLGLAEHALGSATQNYSLMLAGEARLEGLINYYQQQGYSSLARETEKMLIAIRGESL